MKLSEYLILSSDRLPMESTESNELVETSAPEFNHLHSLATYQLSWKEISWSNASRTRNQRDKAQADGEYAQTNRTRSTVIGPGTVRIPVEEIMNRDAVIDTSVTSNSVVMEEATIGQYLQMAEDIQDYLTWDPTLFDFSAP